MNFFLRTSIVEKAKKLETIISIMKVLVVCPKCGNSQFYIPKDGKLRGKKKRCVFCGHSFTIRGFRVNRVKQTFQP